MTLTILHKKINYAKYINDNLTQIILANRDINSLSFDTKDILTFVYLTYRKEKKSRKKIKKTFFFQSNFMALVLFCHSVLDDSKVK